VDDDEAIRAALVAALDPEGCTCCHQWQPPSVTIGVVVFCHDCRPDDVDAYHEALITGPWPPAVLAEGWECPHLIAETAGLLPPVPLPSCTC
jgi:hypothetical protein